ncbi:flagellar hook-basal body complex protein [Aliarcobacter cryaerophilus]|uniref:flagellar hook-basal body complex protein n=1 Tax=Aliarcobacter cryaerophilus TaxID=28198 RepID=UPI0021B2695B|nr:flagellar hook-basal body complex protein [Aliarcobacter cryaerophilus]MCT7467537.1 flagellar hook-basal body complex protein [Aliarcobacter cryaerophilus]
MIGALWTGISGLAAHQTALDNESNNIANVNTVGYKASRISFADQIYQNKIGKGSFVQDAEKIFVTGGSKITGVEYDVALQGDGFFTVINKNTLGTAETFYTRAGNFRMGESGTLQTADGYEVQGWAMSKIDPKNDVKSTNQNATRFTDDYIKTLGSTIIRHKDYIETIAAKSTNFNETVKSDNVAVFSGAGAKTHATKLKDIDEAIKDYNSWLQKYQEDPNLPSKGSIAQVSQVNFKTGTPPTSIIGKDGDSIRVVINGNTYTQKFIETKSTEDSRQKLWSGLTADEIVLYGLMDPATIQAMPTSTESQRSAKDIQVAKYDQLFGKIETYKAMADMISNKEPAVVATMAKNRLDPTSDMLDPNGMYEESSKLADMLRGVIQIKSLIPGKEFKITEVSETTSGTDTTVKGTYQSTAKAVEGSGKQALDDSREALSRLISGNQRSVYTTQDLYGLGTETSTRSFSFSIDVYDKDLEKVIPVPNDGGNPENSITINFTTGYGNIDDIVDKINNERIGEGPQIGDYIVAKNVNGNLVLETLDSKYDIEFDAKLNVSPSVNLNTLISNTGYTYTINTGSGTPITIPFSVGNTVSGSTPTIQTAFETAINNFNNTPGNESYRIKTPLEFNNGIFSIVSEKGRVLSGDLQQDAPTASNTPEITPNPVAGTPTVKDTGGSFTVAPVTLAPNATYSMTVEGQVIIVQSGLTMPTNDDIAQLFANAINNNTALSGIVTATPSGNNITINQVGFMQDPPSALSILDGNAGGPWTPGGLFTLGTPARQEFTLDLNNKSQAKLTFVIDGINLEIETGENETATGVFTKLQTEFNKYPALADKYSISSSGTNIVVTQKGGIDGYTAVMTPTPSTLAPEVLVAPNWSLSQKFIETNPDYSGRRGAGAEFMEITTRVDQISTQDSLQLRLDKLDISDSKFGSFRVDDTGLITIKDGGVEYAVGQLSIARFTNNRGLEAVGNNNFQRTQESGNAIYSINNNNTSGVKGQALELSKADLSESLVNLMVFQRAFEANAKSITTSDELLSTLINLKR